MFGSPRNPASIYAKVNVDTGVSQANPHQLIDLLFQRAQDLLATADTALINGDLAGKGESITKVIRILDEGLRAALDPAAGEIAQNLDALYGYCLNKLLEANRDNDHGAIAEVRSILAEIHSGWREIAPGKSPSMAAAA